MVLILASCPSAQALSAKLGPIIGPAEALKTGLISHAEALEHGAIAGPVEADETYTDEASAHAGLARDFDHAAVNHSVGEYVREQAHTNVIESFWSMLKRAHKGTFHKISPKHLDRYVTEFAGRHNVRDADTVDQMLGVVAGMGGKRLRYNDLIADNGLDSGARA